MYRKAAETVVIGLICFWILLNAFDGGLCLGLFVGAILLTMVSAAFQFRRGQEA